MRTPKRPRTGTVNVNGHVATRTRRAGSPATKRKAAALKVAEMRQVAYGMSLQYVSQTDIAKALGISQARVSQLLTEEFELRKDGWEKTADEWREHESRRIEAFCSKWARKAEADPRAADVLLSWAERRDRILGLYINKTELSGPGGRPLGNGKADPPLDLSLLTTDELATFERLMQKAMGITPPDPEPAPPPVFANPEPLPRMLPPYTPPPAAAPAPVDEPYATFIPKPATPSLIDQYFKLKSEGAHPYDIAERLHLSRSALDSMVERYNTERLNPR